MNSIAKVIDMWQLKLLFGSIFALFSPFSVSITILLMLIVIDTATGSFHALKNKRFNIKKFQKGIGKILSYLTTVFVVRLLEAGISSLVTTSLITHFAISLLVLTEAVSVLKNLTLLGVPLPSGFLKVILGNLNHPALEELFAKTTIKQNFQNEINEIIEFQLPLIQPYEMRRILEIKFEVLKTALNVIEYQFSNSEGDGNDLIYYRFQTFFNTTTADINEKWKQAKIPEEFINRFNSFHQPRLVKWLKDIHEVCYSSDGLDQKKKLIMEKTTTLLYQTIIDAQKNQYPH